MQFHFSIRANLKASWELFKANAMLLVVLSLVFVILNLVSRNHALSIPVVFTVSIASALWSYVYMKIILQLVEGKNVVLSFETIKRTLPTFKQFLSLFAVGLLTGVIVIVGLILLIVPGLYLLVRLGFANVSYIDHTDGIVSALKHSWRITKGDAGWTIILVMIILFVLVLLGVLLLGIGILVTYPLGVIFFMKLYRALLHRHNKADQRIEARHEHEYEKPASDKND